MSFSCGRMFLMQSQYPKLPSGPFRALLAPWGLCQFCHFHPNMVQSFFFKYFSLEEFIEAIHTSLVYINILLFQLMYSYQNEYLTYSYICYCDCCFFQLFNSCLFFAVKTVIGATYCRQLCMCAKIRCMTSFLFGFMRYNAWQNDVAETL